MSHAKSIRYLTNNYGENPVHLDDTLNGWDVDGTTFPGKPGKIDYVMVDHGAMVMQAWVDRNWDDSGKASDHWPVAAVVDLLY